MDLKRLQEITQKYAALRIAIIGDFCLDRYFEIDPARNETSIETGLTVYNITRVRCQPGGAGTILNNISALGVKTIYPVGFAGEDGEGWELRRALENRAGVRSCYFHSTTLRQTFTYTKPLLLEPGKPPVELNRLDIKNWDPTPAVLQGKLIDSILAVGSEVNAVIILDQVDLPETGVVTRKALEAVKQLSEIFPELLIMADSRRTLKDFPAIGFKMNRAELAAFTGAAGPLTLEEVKTQARELAQRNKREVIVTLAEDGLVGAAPSGEIHHVPALPLRGEIDIVGAGDAVTANITAAMAAGADLKEALEIASIASSIVIHQLGTTGTASVPEIIELFEKQVEPPV